MSGTLASAVPVAPIAAAQFPPTTEAIPRIRASTVATLTGWSLDPEAVELAEIVVAELATNAVRASGPGDEFVAVRLSVTGCMVTIEVWNRDDSTVPSVTRPDPDSETGRGLLMVEALCSRWSWYRTPSGGVAVLAQFPGRLLPVPRGGADEPPMPTRRPQPVDEPLMPLTVYTGYSTDPAVITRVCARLRALDDWPHPAGQAPVGPAPVSSATDSGHRSDLPCADRTDTQALSREAAGTGGGGVR
ncbi:ATP-binding protein [Pseudofrankia sp. DC12]|uniref:ATP-binding protein n=1 Tax=Pseudofrankia sp. DC12 TaxID=683315 RepID=UPI000696006A|nr:ATP-binding protein [Pseudofrankia sp. DC12]